MLQITVFSPGSPIVGQMFLEQLSLHPIIRQVEQISNEIYYALLHYVSIQVLLYF